MAKKRAIIQVRHRDPFDLKFEPSKKPPPPGWLILITSLSVLANIVQVLGIDLIELIRWLL